MSSGHWAGPPTTFPFRGTDWKYHVVYDLEFRNAYLITPYTVSGGAPIVLGPPLTGAGWVALNGCGEPGFPIEVPMRPSTAGSSMASASPSTGRK